MFNNNNKKIFIIFSLFLFLSYKNSINIMYSVSQNFGDNLNYFLLKDMIDKNIKFYNTYEISLGRRSHNIDMNKIKNLNKLAKIDLFFIGSILENISNWTYVFHNQSNKCKTIISKLYFKILDYFFPLIIFGTGFISQHNFKKEFYVRNIKIIAVRGKKSLERLKSNGIKASKNVILADPGILAPMLINLTNINKIKFTKEYELCVIPHYIDWNNKLIKENIHIDNSIIISINKKPIEFLNSISKCRNVLSSGLHALIIADSLGIPNMRMVLSDKVIGGDYKFIDYYSAYELKLPPKIDLRKTNFTYNDLKNLTQNHFISGDIIRNKQCELLSNFPFKLSRKYKIIKNKICRNIY